MIPRTTFKNNKFSGISFTSRQRGLAVHPRGRQEWDHPLRRLRRRLAQGPSRRIPQRQLHLQARCARSSACSRFLQLLHYFTSEF